MMLRSVALMACLGLFLLGCGSTPPTPAVTFGGPNGTMTWTSPGGQDNPIPGIDYGAVFAVGKALVVWGDATRGAGGRSGSIGSQGAEGDGYLDSHDGRRVEFSYAIEADGTGRVTVDGVDYDLAKGNVFLVRAEGGGSRVKQLRRDLGHLRLDPEYFKSLGRSDAEISAFFTGTQTPK